MRRMTTIAFYRRRLLTIGILLGALASGRMASAQSPIPQLSTLKGVIVSVRYDGDAGARPSASTLAAGVASVTESLRREGLEVVSVSDSAARPKGFAFFSVGVHGLELTSGDKQKIGFSYLVEVSVGGGWLPPGSKVPVQFEFYQASRLYTEALQSDVDRFLPNRMGQLAEYFNGVLLDARRRGAP